MLLALLAVTAVQPALWLEFEAKPGPGNGKHVVLLAGDEEYRSEEMLPAMARILSERHGFRTTVLFSINAKGEIDPNMRNNQPGLEALRTADAMVVMLRFREWPDDQMKHFVAYYRSGRPIIGVRTSTHAFEYGDGSMSAFRDYGWRSRAWPGGFGEQVLGENWISHWGDHKVQGTRGVIPRGQRHPILRGVRDVFGDTDVYEAAPPKDAEVLLLGEVTTGLRPNDPPFQGRKKTAAGVEQGVNDPMMPVAWIRTRTNEAGRTQRIFTTTMGSATDFANEGFRRLMVNSVFWATGLAVPTRANVDLVGPYVPTPYGFEGFRRGVKPADLR